MRPGPVLLIAIAALSAPATPRLQPLANPQGTLQAVSPVESPTLGQIVERAVERAKAQDDAEAELRFESLVRTTIDTYDDDGDVTRSETTVHRRYPLDGALFDELIQRDGEPLGDREIQDEHRKREDFRRVAREAAANGTTIETNDERQIRFDDDLMARYEADVVSEAMVRGHRCWVVAFRPRGENLPENSRMDKALNQSSGQVYITQDDYGVMLIEFELLRPVRYMWGLIASLSRASGRLEFERVDDGIWLPSTYDVRLDLRVLFRTNRQRVVRTWVERTRLDPGRAVNE